MAAWEDGYLAVGVTLTYRNYIINLLPPNPHPPTHEGYTCTGFNEPLPLASFEGSPSALMTVREKHHCNM